ncbi:hypothetical protein JKP88DRAFT_149745, partial [Tribonema minus]
SDTVDFLKEAIEGVTRLPVKQLSLLFEGKQLAMGCLLSDYGIKHESVVHFILRLRAG